MADIFDSWFGESGYQPGGMFDSSWQFSMPQAGDLMQWSPNQTNPALTDLFGLGQIGAAGAGSNWTPPAMPNTNLVPNARGNPGLAAVYANQPGGGARLAGAIKGSDRSSRTRAPIAGPGPASTRRWACRSGETPR